ncbi:MAG TPA: alpha/beta hydrolase [Candidatus Latescibacteria bacterium]|nr:alpha/beta hydrolase [Candidatus Latescibacterota bacterium]
MPSMNMPWGTMAYTDSGDAGAGVPTMLFLHGTGCDAGDWDAVIAALPPTVRKVTLEFRGHGRSSVPNDAFTFSDLADDVVQFIGAMKLRRVILVGHSLGGMVGMQVAPRCRDVAVLVLLEGWTRLGCMGKAFRGERFYGRLDAAATGAITRKRDATMARFSTEAWEHFWQSVREFDGSGFLSEARIPILEVYGGMGRVPGAEHELRVPENLYIQTVWIPDAGHYLPIEKPFEVAKICADMAEFV